MDFYGILRDVLRFPFRNGKLMLSIALLLLIPSSFMFLGNNFALKPLIMVFNKAHIISTKKPIDLDEYIQSTAEIEEDVPLTIDEETIITTLSIGVSILSMIGTIYMSAVTYYDDEFSIKDMLWKNPTVRWLCMTIFAFLAVVLIGVPMAINGPVALVSLGLLIALLVVFSSLYLAVVWMVGHLITVLIEDCCETWALGNAGELMKEKMLQRFVHSLLLTLVAMAMSGILGLEMGPTRYVIWIAAMNIGSLVTFIVNVVFTVLYYEYKKSGERNVIEMERENGNKSLVSTTTLLVDDSLP